MRYWVISPNIGMSRGTKVQRWKELILQRHAVFMGWRPRRREDGRRGLGLKFAEGIKRGDVVLSAQRRDWKWTVLACGIVKEDAPRKPLKLGREYRHGSYRLLKPFVPLDPNPKASGLLLKATSPGRRRQIAALTELHRKNLADRRVCERLRAILGVEDSNLSDPTLDSYDEEALDAKRDYVEGRHRLVAHRRLEGVRNRQLVTDARRFFKKRHSGVVYCEICGVNFEEEYGTRGADFIEVHHRVPIAKIKKETRRRFRDLAMVCANCHRMLHRDPWTSVESLRTAWKKSHRTQ